MAEHTDHQNALTPRRIVDELDRYIVGQTEAKRAVAIALRNRLRRQKLSDDLRQDVTPKNILMMGPTGVGKTEIARRMARLVNAPFVKVEATRFTQVGYVGRDVDSIIRDLIEAALAIEQKEQLETVRDMATKAAEEKLVELLTEKTYREALARTRRAARAAASATIGSATRTTRVQRPSKTKIRGDIAEQLANKELEDHQIEIEIEVDESAFPLADFVDDDEDDETLRDIFGLP
ncbi:MAG TPA: AAA family ATPase, partial [Ktedonobacterales bacterium]